MRHAGKLEIAFAAIAFLLRVLAFLSGVLGGREAVQRPSHLRRHAPTRPLGYNGYARNTSPDDRQAGRRRGPFREVLQRVGMDASVDGDDPHGRLSQGPPGDRLPLVHGPGLPTLAAILRKAGYDTRAYVSHVFLKPIYGFGDGFGSFDFSVLNVGHPHDVSTGRSSPTS